MDRLDRILALVRMHRPGVRLVDKHDVPWMRAVAVAVRPLIPTFMEHVTTVIGDTVYLPAPPSRMDRDLLARILAHELVHQLDQAEHGLAFYATYAAVPLPVGRTLRAHWERRAYTVDLLLAHHEGGERGLAWEVERLVRLFAGPTYGFMWAGAGAARAYVEHAADEVRTGRARGRPPYRDILAAWSGEDGCRSRA
jgi:hypothetical protein